MSRPKLYKEHGMWYCQHKQIKVSGTTAVEAFLNYFLCRLKSELPPDEM